MSRPAQSWALWRQSKSFHRLPSEILFVEDEYAAYCLNEAIFAFGTAMEAHLDGMKKGKGQSQQSFERQKQMELNRLLELEEVQQKFRSPVAGGRSA